jgi:hypothetical protein
MRLAGNIYEYIAVYVDDIAIPAKDPMSIITILSKKHKVQLKNVGPNILVVTSSGIKRAH